MIAPEEVLRARLRRVQMYQAPRNQALTSRWCGISKKTLRKWCRRYKAQGEEGLRSQSRPPHKLPPRKVMQEHEALILELRRTRRLGPKGLQREMVRLHQLHFSSRTIWKVLHAHGVSVLCPVKRPRRSKRYNHPVPGDRVQIDSCKNLYQFTAIDDCTRMRVLALYSARSSPNAAHFLREHVLKELPFPIQRIQSDRGLEFIGLDFQDALREQHIKFRPNRPRAPHLNGKVERSQRTDRMEFWATVDIKAPREQLEEQLAAWQSFYNSERTHSSLNSKTPNQRFQEVQQLIPTHQQVQQAYGPTPQTYVTNMHHHWALPNSSDS